MKGKYTGEVRDRPIEVIVYDDMVGQLAADPLLLDAQLEAPSDLLVGVATASHPFGERLRRRRNDKHHHRVGEQGADLPGAVDVDLEDEIAIRRIIRHRGARELPGHDLGPFKEPPTVDRTLERLVVNEGVRVGRFAW